MLVRRYTGEDVVRTLVRRRWIALLPLALGVAAAPLIAKVVPAKYRSETLIMVIPQRVPDSYVKSTVTERIEDRLPSISDQILSRSRLERIILDLDLYRSERQRQVMEDVVARMGKDIVVGLEGKKIDSFRVTYVSNDPKTAQKVTERLASLYIEQNLKDRETQADSTSRFLETELEQAKERLITQEKKLEEYRRQNAGQLPTQLQGNLQSMQNANLQLQALRESSSRSQERRLLLERQLADARALPAAVPASGAQGTTVPQPLTTAEQLDLAKARLEAAKQRFTPDHPDVLSQERQVAELQARLDAETPVGAVREERPLSPDELVREKRIKDLEAELAVLDHHLTANRDEELRLQRVIAEYQKNIDVLPTRESELTELMRDYGTLQTAYATLLMKREDSKIAANLERRQIGEQFRILDPASLPQKPSNRVQRAGLIASGGLVGLVLGLLAIGALEYRDSTFRREEEILRVLELPVLALIPVIASDREKRARRRTSLLADLAGAAALLAAVAIVAYWRFSL
jgi:polysaccharide chain length determinant protein (PEP-CTERM system associated)